MKGNAVIDFAEEKMNTLLLFFLILNTTHANSLSNLFTQSGLEFGGWINGGATYNANNPSDGFNGAVDGHALVVAWLPATTVGVEGLLDKVHGRPFREPLPSLI